MDHIWFNAMVLPLFTVALIPTAIRNRKTGEYLGFLNINILVYILTLIILQSFFMINEFGFGIEAAVRAIAITVLPFPLGYAYVALTHKQQYGEPFDRNKKKGG
mgnify:CR=1 FL=1|jgi:hypothetical protein